MADERIEAGQGRPGTAQEVYAWIKQRNPEAPDRQVAEATLEWLRGVGRPANALEFSPQLGILRAGGQNLQNVPAALQASAALVPQALGYTPERSLGAAQAVLPSTLPGLAALFAAGPARTLAEGIAPVATGPAAAATRNILALGAPAAIGAGTAGLTGISAMRGAEEGLATGAIQGAFGALGRLAKSVDLFGNAKRIGDAIVGKLGDAIDRAVPSWAGKVRTVEDLVRLRDPGEGLAALRAPYQSLERDAMLRDSLGTQADWMERLSPERRAAYDNARLRLRGTSPYVLPDEPQVGSGEVGRLFRDMTEKKDAAREAFRIASFGQGGNLQEYLAAQKAANAAEAALRDRLGRLGPDLLERFNQAEAQYRTGMSLLTALEQKLPVEGRPTGGAFRPNTLADALEASARRGGVEAMPGAMEALTGGAPRTARQYEYALPFTRVYMGGLHEPLIGGLSERLPYMGIMATPGGNPTVRPGGPPTLGGLAAAPIINMMEQAAPEAAP